MPKVTTKEDLKNFLLRKEILVDVTPKNYGRRYAVSGLSPYEIAYEIKSFSYFSHYSAVFLHGLTINIPKQIYVNVEQSKKEEKNNVLKQVDIDRSFSKPMRKTKNLIEFGHYKIFFINGKFLDQLGVTNMKSEGGEIPVTDMERTLIDIAIRPSYSGGISEVIGAFKAARGKISVNKMSGMLQRMNYIYPYQQAIGFYLEKAGYNKNVVKVFERARTEHRFYLDYDMKNIQLNSHWNLYVPEGL